ncbi:MAG: SLC45 family MFS transporter [Ruminococcaceae bacterium]|nr:SLC45 family MFS transporter [Oscillospiraceae bacterium]
MNVKNGKLDVKKTILTGFGFLATSIAWAIYDPYITKILNNLLSNSEAVTKLSNTLVEKLPILADLAAAQGENVALAGGGFTLVPLFIGIIMTFDNIFGVIFQPTFGRLSDECHSRFGKRRPFILFGAPVSALFFFLIPLVFLGTKSLPLTMICIILFVFTMSLWRAPVVALMPDLTPPALRSEGNAIINLMGGIGGAVGMVAGTIAIALCGIFTGMSKTEISANETVSFPYVFAIGSLVMIAGMLVLMFCVKEQDTSIVLKGENNAYRDAKAKRQAEKEEKKAQKAARKAIKLTSGERKSLLFMLGCLFFLFCGSNAITTFFSLFAQEILHKITSDATILMLIFAVVSGAAAIPAGKMGKKFGRKKTIIAGLSVFLAAFVVFFGVFVGMLGGKGLSINSYVTVNNAYITVNDQVNNFNADVSAKAKADGVKVTDDMLISVEGYIDYMKTVEDGSADTASVYAEFDKALQAASDEAIKTAVANGAKEEDVLNIYDSVISVAASQLGADENTAFSAALSMLHDSVKDITAILGVLIFPVLILGGAANMFITVNTLPLVLEIGGVEKVGTFTGYYYTATFSAQIASPILYGFIRMFAGTYMSLFYYSPVMFALAVILILFVKHGEAIPDELIKEAEDAE